MPLNVCVVSSLYHPGLGGLGRQAQLLSERLNSEGVNLFVIARQMEGLGEAFFSPAVEIVRIPSFFPEVQILEEISFQNILISLSFTVGCLMVLLRRRQDYDIVHFHGASIPLFVCLPVLKLLRKKVVAKVAAARLGTEAGSLRERYWFIGDLLTRHIKMVDAFVAISEEIRQGLLHDGIPDEKIFRIPNFIDTSLFFPPAANDRDHRKESLSLPREMIVCYAGRFVTRKGLDCLLKAWEEVHRAFPGAVLLLLGEGPLEVTIKHMATTLDVGSSVRFGGRVENIADFLRASDLFVLPSLQEGLPNSLLEAMASGLPSVSSRIGGVVDLIEDSASGILVDPGDPLALCKGLNRLLSDKGLREKIAAEALRLIRERFSIEAIFPRYIDLYAKLMTSEQ